MSRGSKLSREITAGYSRASVEFLCLYCSRPRAAEHRHEPSPRPRCIDCYTKGRARRAALRADEAGVGTSIAIPAPACDPGPP